MPPSGIGAGFEYVRALVAGLAEEAEGGGKIFRRKPGFFGESLGGKVIGVAVGRRLADFDPTFLDATFQIGVRKAERDTKLMRGGTLGDATVLMHRTE